MFYVYVIYSQLHKEFYFGFTENLKQRINKHRTVGDRYTKRYKDWKLIYYEACLNKKDARHREKYLKTTQGRRMLKLRIKEYLNKPK